MKERIFFKHTFSTEGELDIAKVNSQYTAVRQTTHLRTQKYETSQLTYNEYPANHVETGLVRSENMEAVYSKATFKFEDHIFALTPESVERFRTLDYILALEEIEELDAYDVATGKCDGMFVIFNFNNFTLTDLSGNYLPVQIAFDYIEGHMDSDHYDLLSVVTELSKREDIEWGGDPYASNIEKWASISKVPHYNRSHANHRCVAFVWSPSTEDYRKIWKWCEDHNRRYPSYYEAIRAMDLLGIERYRVDDE